jgi:hypothetical protein
LTLDEMISSLHPERDGWVDPAEGIA